MGQKKSILLVEDDQITADIHARLLQKYGYEVKHVRTGEESVDAAQAQKIDLILMDIDLGAGIDGTEAAERILAQNELPILFLSSHTEPEVVEKTERITSYGYVVKNTGITVLDASIKMAFKLFSVNEKLRIKERAIRFSEEKFHNIFQLSPIAMSIADLVSGIFVEVNQKFEEIFKMNRSKIIGKSSVELKIWKDNTIREKYREQYIRDGFLKDIPVEVFDAEGNTIQTISSFYRLRIGNENLSIAMVQLPHAEMK